MSKSFLFLSILFLSSGAFSGTVSPPFPKKSLVPFENTCGHLLTYLHSNEVTAGVDPTQILKPYYSEENRPLGMSMWGMRQKFAQFTTFSSDGQYVLLHHDIYPDAEQVSLRKVETGQLMGSFIWRAHNRKVRDLRSVTIDVRNGRVLAIADRVFEDNSDEFLIGILLTAAPWNGLKFLRRRTLIFNRLL